jgi:hypothetical protein
MKRAVAVCGAVAMMFIAASAFAQGKTDFSGKWTPEAPAAGAAGAGGGGGRGGGFNGPMTISQTATELTIERETPNGATKAVYKLDGSESSNTMGQGTAKSKATWDGAKLKIETTTETQNGTRTSTAVYSIDGGKLSVATTQPGRNGGEPTTRTTTYTKG